MNDIFLIIAIIFCIIAAVANLISIYYINKVLKD